MISRGRSALLVALGVAALALLVGRGVTTLVAEQAWYAALDAGAVWRERLLAGAVLLTGGFLAGSAFAFANLWAVRATILHIAVPTRVSNLEIPEVVPNRRLLLVVLGASAAAGAVLCAALPDWVALSRVWRGVPFGEYEGIWQHDLGFYVYWLPFEEALYVWALLALTLVTAMVTFLYAVTRSLRLEERRLVASTHARRHLTVLGALVLVLLAWSYRLDAYDILRWGTGGDGLFARVDHAYTLRADVGLAVASLATALVVLRAGWVGQVRTAFYAVTAMLVGALVLHEGLPGVLARGEAFGPVATRDAPYREMRATFSRRAWAVEGMAGGSAGPTTPEVPSLAWRVGLWDVDEALLGAGVDGAEPLLAPLTWRPGASGPEGLLLARDGDGGWSTRAIQGVELTDDGRARVSRLAAGRGRVAGVADAAGRLLVHPGATGYRLVDGQTTEATLGEARIRAVPLAAAMPRLAHAWAERDPALLREEAGAPPPAIVRHRDVRDRVQRLVPGLALGSAVHPVLTGDALWWAVSLYAASDDYPFAIRLQAAGAPRRYFRHAASALVHAQTGEVRIAPVAAPDPLAETWLRLVPSLLVARDSLPASVQRQLPVPADGALATARAFTRVGARDVPAQDRFLPDSAVVSFPPAPVVWPGDPDVAAWTVPVLELPQHLSGVLVARGGPDAGVTWVPMAPPRPRWDSLRARLDVAVDAAFTPPETEAARAADATTSTGEGDASTSDAEAAPPPSPIRRGRVRTLVADGRPVLVQPLYDDAAGVRTPRLAAVAVLVGDSVAVSPTLADAIARLGGAPARLTPPRPDDLAEARRLYDVIRDALADGDFTRFGATLDSLGRLLERLPPR